MAETALQKDLTLSRLKFRASRKVRDAMINNPDFSRKTLTTATKSLVREDDDDCHLQSLQRLEKQGHMSRCSSPDGGKIWAKALQGVRDEHLRFALNSAVDTLPHNANLFLWKKHTDDACPLCGERQSLIHVLNTCSAAHDGRRFNTRHDRVLAEITSLLSSHVSSSAHLASDLGSYIFPHHIVPTDLRPDIVWWDDARSLRQILLIELTICFETSFIHAAERKELKYEGIIERARAAGYRGRVITLQVGSRGIIDQPGFQQLRQEFDIPSKVYGKFLADISSIVIHESYNIWCLRNSRPPSI